MTACMTCVRLENKITQEQGDLAGAARRAHRSEKARLAIPHIKEVIAISKANLAEHIKENHG